MVEPNTQTFVCHEIQPDEVQKSWERPFVQRSLLEYLNQQRHNGSCPNLAHDGIFIGAQKAFDLQVLLDFFEAKLDLPAFFVERRNLLRFQILVVGQEVKPSVIVLVVPLNDPKLKIAASFSPGRAVEFKPVVAIVVTLAETPLLERRRNGIVLESCDKCCATLRKPSKQRAVVVATIHNNRYVVGRQLFYDCLSLLVIVYLACCQIHYTRHQVIVVDDCVQLETTF